MVNIQQRIALGAIILLLSIMLSAWAMAATGQEGPPPLPVPAIEVTGSGLSLLTPDMATVRVGVTREARTAREALDQANTAMQSVIKSLMGSGVDKKDLQTENFSIRPRYRSGKFNSAGGESSPSISGYTVSNTLKITVRDLKRLGSILDTVVSLGVNTGGDIRFSNSDPAPALKQARIRTMAKAADKAKTHSHVCRTHAGQGRPRCRALGHR